MTRWGLGTISKMYESVSHAVGVTACLVGSNHNVASVRTIARDINTDTILVVSWCGPMDLVRMVRASTA